jgi:hypothetical protein
MVDNPDDTRARGDSGATGAQAITLASGDLTSYRRLCPRYSVVRWRLFFGCGVRGDE